MRSYSQVIYSYFNFNVSMIKSDAFVVKEMVLNCYPKSILEYGISKYYFGFMETYSLVIGEREVILQAHIYVLKHGLHILEVLTRRSYTLHDLELRSEEIDPCCKIWFAKTSTHLARW